jgi:TRAP-type C4-dicarboxylate transport system permease large subunit
MSSTFSSTSTPTSIEYDISYTPKPSSVPLIIKYSNDSSQSSTPLIMSIVIPFIFVCIMYNILYYYIRKKQKKDRQARIQQEILIIQENPLYSANV